MSGRCLRDPACRDGHRWSGSGLGARGRCSHPWSLSCLVISSLSSCHPSPPPPPRPHFCHLHVSRPPPASSPAPGLQRELRRGSPGFPDLGVGGEQKGGGLGVSGREGAWLERPGMGVSKSINHAPLRSCLTHTSPTSCQ